MAGPGKHRVAEGATTLESTVLHAFAQSVRARKPSAAPNGPDLTEVGEGTLAALARQSDRLLAELRRRGLLNEKTVRIRPRGGRDRRFIVEYAVDPHDDDAVLFRLRPASGAKWEQSAANSMMTTQQAADLLNVSRPYVVKLVEDGVIKGVERTRAGHRRIPAAEIQRIGQDMRLTRQAALAEMEALTADARLLQLEDAHRQAKRRWVKKT